MILIMSARLRCSEIHFHYGENVMGTKNVMEPLAPTKSKTLDQYGCGPIQLAGADNGLYERHLLFDNVIELAGADARDRFDAFARSVRGTRSQRWTLTE